MRKIFSLILMTLVVAIAYASDIECVGVATQVVNGTDTSYIFKDEIHLRSTIGDITWYHADGTEYASGTDEIYPGEGCYKAAGHSFCVYLYTDIADLDFTVEPDCESTIIRVTGDMGSLARTYSLSYNALAWNGEQWYDSAAVHTGKLRSVFTIPALYGTTPLRLCYDPEVRSALGLDSACVEVQLQPEEVRAVNMQLTHIATTRGEEGEKSNERNRPSSETLITGSEYSGPLEVAFYSNPTPAVLYYRWSIYKATELIVNRFDPDIRYTFSEPGTYRVVCSVNNTSCQTDSSEVTVAIAESYLAVPNAFTPNNDGQNDEFRVAYRSLREFHIWVYNRWGKLVYESVDPAKGWDGTINGRPAAVGAYYYVIRALGTDAPKDAQYIGLKAVYKSRKANADKSVVGVYQLSGDINLLR